MLLTLRGRWDEAEAGLRRLLAGDDPGVLASFGLSALGRLLARKGDPAAGPLDRTAGRGAERYRGELLRYLARCGHPVDAPAGCPPEFALGIEGDWAGAAALWRSLGAPYEHALELASSGRRQELLEALAALDRLGAAAAANLVRRDLRQLGVTHLPRRPAPAPAPTRPASPTASSKSSASPTPRSPTSWWSPCAPSTTTSPPSCPSSTSVPAARPPAPPPTWAPR